MKFELIGETLYIIMDTPNPLWCNAEFPCLVSRKEDGDIGIYTKIHVSGLIGEKLVATGTKDGVIMLEDVVWNSCELPYIYFNVIGYPVAKGSEAYALYCMSNGYMVRNKIHHPNTYLHMDGDDIEIVESGKAGERRHKETWDKGYRKDSGWQIYEPQPQYNVGDWVEVHGCCQARVINIEYSPISGEAKYATLSDNNRIRISYITRKLKPSEVVLNFGNGIKGNIEPLYCECCKDKVFILRISKEQFIEIPIAILTEPMKSTVLELLKAQEEEK